MPLLPQARVGALAPQRPIRSDQHPARDLDPLRVDPAIALGQQRCDGGADVVGQAGPTERRDAGDEGVHLLVVAHCAAAEVGFNRAGGDRVDRNAARSEVLGEVARRASR